MNLSCRRYEALSLRKDTLPLIKYKIPEGGAVNLKVDLPKNETKELYSVTSKLLEVK